MDELYRIVERLGVLGGCLERGGTKSGHSNLSMMILRTPLGWETPSIPTLNRQLTESTFAFNDEWWWDPSWTTYEVSRRANMRTVFLRLFASIFFFSFPFIVLNYTCVMSCRFNIILDSDQMNTGSWFWILAEMMYVAKWRIKSSQRTSSPRGPFWPSEYSSHLLWCTYNTRCRDHPLF